MQAGKQSYCLTNCQKKWPRNKESKAEFAFLPVGNTFSPRIIVWNNSVQASYNLSTKQGNRSKQLHSLSTVTRISTNRYCIQALLNCHCNISSTSVSCSLKVHISSWLFINGYCSRCKAGLSKKKKPLYSCCGADCT